MTSGNIILLLTAASVGIVHTLIGPDHYIPFIALASSRKWSKVKTTLIVILCGGGHVLSSVLIGIIGIALGIAVTQITDIESTRGEIASWILIGVGLAYTAWGIKQSIKNRPHSHVHIHDNVSHSHNHAHQGEHTHVHVDEKKKITPWVLFIIFILGPCEPLIPLVMYPAAENNYFMIVLLTIVFGIVTIASMLVMTFLGLYGVKLIRLEKIEKYIHVLAGASILLCGIAIKIFGL